MSCLWSETAHFHVKSKLITLNFGDDVIYAIPRKRPNDVRKRSFCDLKCQIVKEMTKVK